VRDYQLKTENGFPSDFGQRVRGMRKHNKMFLQVEPPNSILNPASNKRKVEQLVKQLSLQP
jgi:hypothetical protein